ncbi:hypothetical protein KDA_31650 [Dictyobacter alpinus]|uniref:HTH gntR-type domain-containing protein n=1 Tax=Dictyobacter alpinus TaxID=2014873 RepID=A0A402B8I3_9CHLR|nr:substrate-binding domain-containing protein [Dictyobacter alpinus]GCE27681.1 hypothetical protein KDA_31650 [Dictyobacter alpinus]
MVLKQPAREESKLEELSKRLRTLAYERGPDAQLPSIRMLCDMLGTTRVTIGEVLNLLEKEHIVYRKDRQGIYVSPRIYRKSISIMFDSANLQGDTISPFWPLLWVRLEQEAQRRALVKDESYSFHVVNSMQNTVDTICEDITKLIQNGEAHAILAVGLNTLAKDWIDNLHVPYITFAGPGRWIVQLDGVEFGQLATTSLIQQKCKKIGLWMYNSGHSQDWELVNEWRGFREALTRNMIPFNPDLVRQTQQLPHDLLAHKSLTLQEQGYLLAKEVFGTSNHARPDGVVIGDDMMTDGALVALEELGVRIGEELKIVTHANVGSSVLFGRTKRMTVFEYDVQDIVQAMFAMLDILIQGQQPAQEVTWIRPRPRISK